MVCLHLSLPLSKKNKMGTIYLVTEINMIEGLTLDYYHF
jgi:hypothetical protein